MTGAASFWDREAAAFDREPDHGLLDPDIRAAWWDLLTSHLPPAPARVVDVGCGTGTLAVLLAEHGHTVTGVDVSRQMLRRAGSKASAAGVTVGLVVGDAANPPVGRGAFDAVVCRHVLWALTDIDATLRTWDRLLRPNGVLVLVEGQWATGGGLASADVTDRLRCLGRNAVVQQLTDDQLWGRRIDDDRYLVVSTR